MNVLELPVRIACTSLQIEHQVEFWNLHGESEMLLRSEVDFLQFLDDPYVGRAQPEGREIKRRKV
jgi:hypothetical protein